MVIECKDSINRNLTKLDCNIDEILNSPPFSNWCNSGESLEKLKDSIEDFIENDNFNFSSEAVYRIVRREKTEFEKCSLPKKLRASDFLAIGVVTISEGLKEDYGYEYSLWNEMIIDGLENFFLNQSVQKIANELRDKATEEGLKTTRIFSPGSGSGDLGLDCQKFISKYLDFENIGVEVTSDNVMKPFKTVSFLMGLGENISQVKDLFSCDGCERKDCMYRIQKST